MNTLLEVENAMAWLKGSRRDVLMSLMAGEPITSYELAQLLADYVIAKAERGTAA